MLLRCSPGTVSASWQPPLWLAIAVVEKAVALGVNPIEAARGYGNSEERVGKALKRILKHTPRARELDMGVFIISPRAQGGNLHSPTASLKEVCAPLTPVEFNHHWLLSQGNVHTVSCGPSTPDDVAARLLAQDSEGSGAAGEGLEH